MKIIDNSFLKFLINRKQTKIVITKLINAILSPEKNIDIKEINKVKIKIMVDNLFLNFKYNKKQTGKENLDKKEPALNSSIKRLEGLPSIVLIPIKLYP